MYVFQSFSTEIGNATNTNYSTDIIKNEPMLFNCNKDFAVLNGGPITKEILENLPVLWKDREDLVIDSRVHMLMPGMYPCIPGWHHDDIPRNTINNQPNYENMDYFAEHLVVLINGDICPTEVIEGSISVPIVKENIYKVWHEYIEKEYLDLSRRKLKSNIFNYLNCFSFHQGTECTNSGWRFFLRITKNSNRIKTVTNEIRKQVQVYMKDPFYGW